MRQSTQFHSVLSPFAFPASRSRDSRAESAGARPRPELAFSMIPMRNEILMAVCALGLLLPPSASAEPFLVENGEARAELIISETPTRTQRLAARELQTTLKKISGAELPIVSEPSGDFPVKLYVGASSHTDGLGVWADGLRYGAYRIVSGEDWMVFIGDDTDFVPIEP